MTWKSILRSAAASYRQAERQSLRMQKELEKQRKEAEKMQELERAAYEVAVFNNIIDVLTSVHAECSDPFNWESLRGAPPPLEPQLLRANEEKAQKRLDKYRPGIFDKLFKRSEMKILKLKSNVVNACEKDRVEYEIAMSDYQKQYTEWNEYNILAERVLSSQLESFLEAIRKIDPFSGISELGSSIDFKLYNIGVIEVTLCANSEEIIPEEEKTLLKSNKLSVKKMSKNRYYELYQNYICSCALRIAREIFALLPHLNTVLINVMKKLVNTKTGHLEESPVLSVYVPRETLNKLNFERIDPVNAMANFIHNMNFKKTTGFAAIEKIQMDKIDFTNL